MNDAKKIGILFGQENSFPQAFIDRVNQLGQGAYKAEAVLIDKVFQGMPTTYHVIVDRISHDVPFYRAYVKNAALQGTAVINNPFWWSADEKFFNNCLAEKIDIALPKTAILPLLTSRRIPRVNPSATWPTLWTGIAFSAMSVSRPI
ncbi:ATP-grasp domain-containing protein [Arachidicoccus ginsenosidivorans]|uniref:hypothetical protein n=1 Tax=Arachidicoccus ginsenosidivorans TaxID=496057 RepID=UPI001CEF7DB6|nr:hypothetical protein [Arachidicoccus ginsenosidivorans]